MEDQKEEIIETGGEKNEKKEMDSSCSEQCKKKTKNYLSIIILLAGLLVGSVFVDVAQFFGQQGLSPRALKSVDVFPLDGRTWVAFNEPVVNAQIVTDSSCAACDPTEPLKWMKRVIPTILAKKVEMNSPEGQKLVSQFNIKSLPAFIFDESVTKTDVYAQAQSIFTKVDSSYIMDTEQVGIKPGKFLATPEVKDDDPQIGPKDAKVKVVLFSDFQCPYCKAFNDTFEKAISDYKDKVLFAYKYLPLEMHKQAMNAAIAAGCANDQGKFWEMSNKLYGSQADWQNTDGTAKFKTYAPALGLNAVKFNQCMDSNGPKDKIAADMAEAQSFNISGTPAFFVNDQFFGGLVSYDQLKKALDDELAK